SRHRLLGSEGSLRAERNELSRRGVRATPPSATEKRAEGTTIMNSITERSPREQVKAAIPAGQTCDYCAFDGREDTPAVERIDSVMVAGQPWKLDPPQYACADCRERFCG